jgi:hypothetical protein
VVIRKTIKVTQLVGSCQLRAEFFCQDKLSAEAEESPLLEEVSRERLMKTQNSGKRLSGCYGDL